MKSQFSLGLKVSSIVKKGAAAVALLAASVGFTSFGFANSQPDSVYTHLDLYSRLGDGLNGNCYNVLQHGDGGESAKYLCDRVGGFSLFFEKENNGEWLSVSLGHYNMPLPFGIVHGTHFITLPAMTVEWRGVRSANGVFEPFALIVRTRSVGRWGDSRDGKVVEKLVVTKLSRAENGICIIGTVDTSTTPNANVKAREMADALIQKLTDPDAVPAQCLLYR